MLCTSSSSATVSATNTNDILNALCYKTSFTPGGGVPQRYPNTGFADTCPTGMRLATMAEAATHIGTLCPPLTEWAIIELENHGTVRGYGYGAGCPITPNEPGNWAELFCVTADTTVVSIQIVKSGECTAPCATCSLSVTTCTSCMSTHPRLYNGGCYDTCPIGSYPDSSTSCACKES